MESISTRSDLLPCGHCAKLFNNPHDLWDLRSQVRGGQAVNVTRDSRQGIDIYKSGQSGCQICALYWSYITGSDSLHRSGGWEGRKYGTSVWLGWNDVAESFFYLSIGPRLTRRLTDFSMLPADSYRYYQEGHRIHARNTVEAECWTMILAWSHECLQHHSNCHLQSTRGYSLPTRLINVSNQRIRLVVSETGIRRRNTSYVTLSHRWSSYIPTLTKENLAQRLEGIPQETLPGTFRDAIQATRRLGCSYLWIDSLCIIQDDPKDWAEESSRMGDIYRNGIFNLAATAANDRAPGLFQTRDPTTISSFKVKMTWMNHEKDYLLARFNIWHDGVVNQELNRRGWVLQERLLSPRTIHFGTQIFWECRELQACETWPEGLPFGLRSHAEYERSGAILGSKLHPSSIDASLGTSEGLYRPWKNIVRSYMDCKLTKISDRVVALSGVAKEMKAILKDEYMAGLWRKDLLHELVWFVHHGSLLKLQTGHKMRETEYRAPSWSWASVEGGIRFPPIINATSGLCTVEHIEVSPLAGDSTGKLVGGLIRLRAILCRIPRRFSLCSGTWSVGNTEETSFCPDEWRADLLSEVYALPVIIADSESGFYRVLLSLIVCRTGRSRGEFERVGLLTLRLEENSDDAHEASWQKTGRQSKDDKEMSDGEDIWDGDETSDEDGLSDEDEISDEEVSEGVENEDSEEERGPFPDDTEYEIAGIKWAKDHWLFPSGRQYRRQRRIILV